jgi:hypothetical protein
MRQAVPVPTGTTKAVPAVIFPGPGGSLTNNEASGVGCSNPAGNCVTGIVSTLNASVTVPQPVGNGPTGFVVFSELKQPLAGPSNDPTYILDPKNYVWVMYQVIPATRATPAQIVRFTFEVTAKLNGIVPTANGGWQRLDAEFKPANSNEGVGNGVPIISLNRTTDHCWIMVSHASTGTDSTGAKLYDPQLFQVTAVVNQFSAGITPSLSATLASQVKVEGGLQ